jgi:lysozyme
VTAIDITLPRLKTEEGFRPTMYSDTTGHITIGYGFNVNAGISRNAAAALLQAQLDEIHNALQAYPWYVALDPTRQSVCLDIAFNEGVGGLLKFPHMLAALSRQDWPSAAAECRVADSSLDASRYAPLRQLLLVGGVQ